MNPQNSWDKLPQGTPMEAFGIEDPWKESTATVEAIDIPNTQKHRGSILESPPKSQRKSSLSSSGGKLVTKSQTLNSIQNVFTESQKIAYVSLCYLIIVQHKQKRLVYKKAIASYDEWKTKFMEKLYVYLDIIPEERKMIETLAEHGLESEDLTKGIMQDVQDQETRLFDDQGLNSDDPPPSDIRFTMLSHLYILSISDGYFDARSRTVLKTLASAINVSAIDVMNLENVIANELRLYEYSEKVKHEDGAIVDRNKVEGRNRWLFAGLTAVAGGAVIGLTAGLAAPFIGAGIASAFSALHITGAGVAGVTAFMSGSGGIAAITTTGVLTGGGMGGAKMMKRTRGIEQFEFLGIKDALEIIEQNKQKRKNQTSKNKTAETTETEKSPVSKSLKDDFIGNSIEQLTTPVRSEGLEVEYNEIDFEYGGEKEVEAKQTNVLITIGGWVNFDSDDHSLPFSTIEQGIHGDQYTLIWETKVLKELGSMLSILVSELTSFIVQQGIQAYLLPMLMAALTAPMWAIKLTYLVDNPWGNALTKAEKAGRLLADLLIKQVQGNRPVTLVGYSLGARLIYYCLLELASKQAFGIVEEVYLLGTPAITSKKELDAITSVVSGKIVNGYATNDQLLGILYRASSALWSSVPGLRPILTHGIENIELSKVLNGHMDYFSKMPLILKELGFKITSEIIDDRKKEKETNASKKSSVPSGPTVDDVAEELQQRARVHQVMEDYWEPREIASTLPPLVVNTIKEPPKSL